ncbi:NADH-quinone oxidoreductase subunit L [uncultured bacterium]|nr:NADH-quinone oxidoreductase subunit L [uncultured bacterium]
MYELLWLVPALPFAGFLILALIGRVPSARAAAAVGALSVGLSAALTLYIGYEYLVSPPEGGAFTQSLWQWISAGGLQVTAALRLDALSLLMAVVVTSVGFLIHLYSMRYMAGDDGLRRFFAYMNLFTASMLVLVLSDNLLFLYVGWEGVGLCSYLLIGFWYKERYNGYAARKAFIVTRVGDTLFAIGILVLFTGLGTMNIQELMTRATAEWAGSGLPTLAAALLLGGALGKSAQLPLQTWLPDAMAGPTPVSAFIHAATMVTAGVYLIARTHALFDLAPEVMSVVAVIGAATLLLASFSALVQKDIKRVLAYSTISQIGYMFLALGVGAPQAAMFHFMTHAFFKALLFLGAGAVILAMHHEQDMTKMGGLRKEMPFVFWTFLAGAASLSALPFVTAGYFSKDLILSLVWQSSFGAVLWVCGVAGAFLTALYTFRMVFLTFFGEGRKKTVEGPGVKMGLPLLALAALSIAGGFVETPEFFGGMGLFSNFLSPVFPLLQHAQEEPGWVLYAGAGAPVAGLAAAWLFYGRRKAVDAVEQPLGALRGFWFSGWGFDSAYDFIFVRPFLWLTSALRGEPVDRPFRWVEKLSGSLNTLFVRTQTGKVRWYATGITIGAVLALSAVLL